MLKKRFHHTIIDREVLTLRFTEKLVRKHGRITIKYDFQTLNYRTATFINSMHGYGDVSIANDYEDELYLPEVLTTNQDNIL